MANLETRNARTRLKRRHAPHWQRIQKGLRLGYRRPPGSRAGMWRGEKWNGVGYTRWTFGLADDQTAADGDEILSFEQARDQLLEAAKVGKEKSAKTVEGAMKAYLTWFRSERQSFDNTKAVIDAHINPGLGEYEVSALTYERVQSWKEGLVTAPVRRRGEMRVSVDLEDPEIRRRRQATANRILGVLKAGLEHAHSKKHFRNPEAWRDVKPYKKVNVARDRHLTHAPKPTAHQRLRARFSPDCTRRPEFRGAIRGAVQGHWSMTTSVIRIRCSFAIRRPGGLDTPT